MNARIAYNPTLNVLPKPTIKENPSTEAVNPSEVALEFKTLEEAEKSLGAADWSLNQTLNNPDVIKNLETRNLNAFTMIPIGGSVKLPEGTKYRINELKDSGTSLVRLQLPDDTVKTLLILTNSKSLVESMLLKHAGPPTPNAAILQAYQPFVTIPVPKPKSQFATVKDAEKKYGKIDGSFKNDQSAEQIDVNDLNKKGLDVVGIDDRVDIPEGTIIKKSLINNNKQQQITLVELTLPDGTKKAFLIPSKIEAKLKKVLMEKQGPPSPITEPTRKELKDIFNPPIA